MKKFKQTIDDLIKIVGSMSLAALLLLGVTVGLNARAASLGSVVVAYNTYTNVLATNGAVFSQFVIANATGTNTYLQIFDNATTNLYYTNLAYSTVSYSMGTGTNIYTNYFGVVVSNTYPALLSNSVSAASNNFLFSAPFSATIPANTTVVFDGSYTFLSGLHVTNGLGQVTISGTYR
jgi:hypothetical protein